MERPRLTKKQMLSTNASPHIFERCGPFWLWYRVKEKYWLHRAPARPHDLKVADLTRFDQMRVLSMVRDGIHANEIARIFSLNLDEVYRVQGIARSEGEPA